MIIPVLDRPEAVHQARIISGQAIARSKWEPRERAWYAAKWKLGKVRVDPTLKLAADVFGVSLPYVVEAVDALKAQPGNVAPTMPINSIWANSSAAERDAFVRSHLIEVWDTVEYVTATA